MATQQLLGLCDAGLEVEVFVAGSEDDLPAQLRARENLRFHCHPSAWRYDRWYSRTDITKHGSGALARSWGLRQIGRQIVARQRAQPFDVVYQFSMPELFALRGHLAQLPAIVVHPEVHAAGELRWQRREKALALGSESVLRHHAIRSTLVARSLVQRRDLRRAALVIAPGARFARLLEQDYGLDARRLRVVPNPIDLERFTMAPHAAPDRPRRLLFVSRIAVRKGVELVVELSHRLADLRGHVLIEVLGDRSLWSDYRHLLADLHPGTAVACGHVEPDELRLRLRGATAVLQPSHYEPFALTVAEALASGTPAITTDEVGATEEVDPRVGIRVPAGDAGALEVAVRALLDAVEDPAQERALRALARAEAERLFDPAVVGRRLAHELRAIGPAA